MAKFTNIGVGWLKNDKSGNEYIFVKGGNDKEGYKLLLQNSTGETIEVDKFNVTFNQSKKSDKSPDVSLVFITDN